MKRMTWREQAALMADIVNIAGGRLIGRTKLQKTVYLMHAAGWEQDAFSFCYFHYGPYSEAVVDAVDNAVLLNLLEEEEHATASGNPYWTYKSTQQAGEPATGFSDEICCLIRKASKANAIELELAATALYLAQEEECETPWKETERRKPQKSANGLLERAKTLYTDLKNCVPQKFPELGEE